MKQNCDTVRTDRQVEDGRAPSRWRKRSWESECVYGGKEIIPAVFMDLPQTFAQKYIQQTTEGAGLGSVVVSAATGKYFKSVHVNKCWGCILRRRDTLEARGRPRLPLDSREVRLNSSLDR